VNIHSQLSTLFFPQAFKGVCTWWTGVLLLFFLIIYADNIIIIIIIIIMNSKATVALREHTFMTVSGYTLF